VPLADLARALPALLVVGVLPGLALVTLAVPGWRRWERLAAAPGLSAGMAGVIGLVLHDLRLPFAAATVLPVEGAVALAAVWRLSHRRRRAARGRPEPLATRVRWVVVAAAAAGAASSAMIVAGFHDQPLPLPTDAPVHGIVANGIARTHDTLPVNPDPAEASAWVRPRSGFEAVAALASEVGGPGPTAEMLPFCTLAVALLPLGLAALALEATGSAAIAALAPVLGVGWAFPSVAVFLGEYPYVVDAGLVAPAVVAALRALRRSQPADGVVLLGCLTAAIWVTHGLEAVTALVVGGPLVTARAVRGDRGQALRCLALATAATGSGALLVGLLTRTPTVPRPSPSALAGPELRETAVFAAGIGRLDPGSALTAFLQFAFPSVLTIGLLAAGVAVCVVQRRCRWALVTFALLLAGYLDMLVTGRLGWLWRLLYPWSAEDRLPSVQYWAVPILMAIGTLWLLVPLRTSLRWVLHRLRLRRSGGTREPVLDAVALAAIAALLVLLDMGRDLGMYRGGVRDIGVTGPADLAVMRRMAERLPAGAVILTDGGDDAGQWVPAVTGQVVLLTNEHLKDHPADLRLVALEQACSDPHAAASMLGEVDAVFVGSRTITMPTPRHPWSLHCIAAIPGLSLLAEASSAGGTAAAFVVDHHAIVTPAPPGSDVGPAASARSSTGTGTAGDRRAAG
jgi:hypothetical protein